jgi:ABC-type Fe3+/spermidine/putrescine transport system ATPase subunit
VSAGALALNGITRRFGDHTAVDNVSFEVGKGELLALIGASGSGKTTTLRIVAGYEVPDAGTVSLDGRDITGLPPQKRGFGMVFQHYALFPHMPVEENVAFGLEARGVRNRPDSRKHVARLNPSVLAERVSGESSRYRRRAAASCACAGAGNRAAGPAAR